MQQSIDQSPLALRHNYTFWRVDPHLEVPRCTPSIGVVALWREDLVGETGDESRSGEKMLLSILPYVRHVRLCSEQCTAKHFPLLLQTGTRGSPVSAPSPLIDV